MQRSHRSFTSLTLGLALCAVWSLAEGRPAPAADDPPTAGAAATPGAVATPDAAASPVVTGGSPESATQADDSEAAAIDAAPAPRVDSPFARDLEAVLAAESLQLGELTRRLEAAVGEEQALSVQRQIDALKQQTEVELLRVQARHARAAGLAEQAARLDAAVARLLAPPATRRQGPPPTRHAPH